MKSVNIQAKKEKQRKVKKEGKKNLTKEKCRDKVIKSLRAMVL